MSLLKKVTVYRHNLLGSADSNNEGVLVNETIYDDDGNENERLNYDSSGRLEERIITEHVDGLPVEERLEVNGEPSEGVIRTFDEKGRLLTETKNYLEGGSDTTTYYYEDDKLVLKQIVDSDGDEGEKQTWEYYKGKLVKEVSFNIFGNIESEKVYTYDENGLLDEVVETSFGEGSPERFVSVMDEKGRLISERRYDARNRLVLRNTIDYNDNGKPVLIEEESPQGKKLTRFEYDDAGNNIIHEETDQEGTLIQHIERTFNENSQVLTAEIMVEPKAYQPGQHYIVKYHYDYK